MGEAQTPHFYDFGIFEPVTKPPNQHDLSLETPGHFKTNQENTCLFWKYYFYKFQKMETRVFDLF